MGVNRPRSSLGTIINGALVLMTIIGGGIGIMTYLGDMRKDIAVLQVQVSGMHDWMKAMSLRIGALPPPPRNTTSSTRGPP